MVCRRRARSRDPRWLLSSHSTSCCPVSIHIINKRLYTSQIVCSLCAVHSPDSSTWCCPATALRAALPRPFVHAWWCLATALRAVKLSSLWMKVATFCGRRHNHGGSDGFGILVVYRALRDCSAVKFRNRLDINRPYDPTKKFATTLPLWVQDSTNHGAAFPRLNYSRPRPVG